MTDAIHFSLVPFVAACGANVPGQRTTTLRQNVTCPVCRAHLPPDADRLRGQLARALGHVARWRDLAEKWEEIAEARGEKIDLDRRRAGKFTGGGEG